MTDAELDQMRTKARHLLASAEKNIDEIIPRVQDRLASFPLRVDGFMELVCEVGNTFDLNPHHQGQWEVATVVATFLLRATEDTTASQADQLDPNQFKE